MGDVIPLKLRTASGGVFGQFESGDTIASTHLPVDTDDTLAANSDTLLATQKAVKGHVATASGLLVPKSYLDTDGTLAANSDTRVPTQKAVKAYSDSLIALAKFGGYRLPSVGVNSFVMTAQIGDTAATAWGGSTAAAVNICRFNQFAVGRTIKTNALRMEVTLTASTGSLRLGIFADNNGEPGAVVAQGTVAWAASMLEVTFTEVTLTPGVYWTAACAQHTSASTTNPQYRGGQRGPIPNGWASPVANGTNIYPVKYATISGAFTDNPTPNVLVTTATLAPPIWMKVTDLP